MKEGKEKPKSLEPERMKRIGIEKKKDGKLQRMKIKAVLLPNLLNALFCNQTLLYLFSQKHKQKIYIYIYIYIYI
jgi:hypothetical protein